MCPPENIHAYGHVAVFGRAHSNGNSNLCHLPLQCYSYYTGIKIEIYISEREQLLLSRKLKVSTKVSIFAAET